MRTLTFAGAMACASLFAFQPALAENAEPITITPLSPPVGAGLGPRVDNANGSLTAPGIGKMRQELSGIPGSVALVASEQYQDRYAVTFKDMLSSVPGVFAEQKFGEDVRLSIRGSGLGRNFHLRGITLLQDGIPLNLADGSGDFQEIDPLTIRHLEVYKGGNGLRYGSSALGGAINTVTPTGRSADAQNLLRVEGGSFDTLRTHGAIARAYEKSDFYLAATGTTSEGYRNQSDQQAARLSGNWGYRLSDDAETRFYVAYNNISQEVPGSVSLQNALNQPDSAFPINASNQYARDIRSVRVSNVTTFQATNNLSVDVGGYGQWRELFHPIFQVVDQESWNGGAFARGRVYGGIGGHRNEATFGVNARVGTTDALQYINQRGSRGAKTADGVQDASQVDLYGENRFYLTASHSLVLGGQLIHAERDYTNNLNRAASADRDYNGFSPKLGYLWDYMPGAQAFASVSRSYEPPTFSELVQTGVTGFVPLDAQTAWTGEVGTRGSSGRWAWDMTAYHSRIKDELLGYTTGPNIPAATFNADETVHQGLELGLDVEIGKGWCFTNDNRLVLRQTYNLSDFRFDGDAQYGDNHIAGVPEHLYTAELRYEDARGFHLAPRLEWAPDGAWVDHANTLRAPSYLTFGFGAGVEVREGVELFLDARNLFDERYASNVSTVTDARTASTAVFYPGEGRSVYGGLRVKF